MKRVRTPVCRRLSPRRSAGGSGRPPRGRRHRWQRGSPVHLAVSPRASSGVTGFEQVVHQMSFLAQGTVVRVLVPPGLTFSAALVGIAGPIATHPANGGVVRRGPRGAVTVLGRVWSGAPG